MKEAKDRSFCIIVRVLAFTFPAFVGVLFRRVVVQKNPV